MLETKVCDSTLLMYSYAMSQCVIRGHRDVKKWWTIYDRQRGLSSVCSCNEMNPMIRLFWQLCDIVPVAVKLTDSQGNVKLNTWCHELRVDSYCDKYEKCRCESVGRNFEANMTLPLQRTHTVTYSVLSLLPSFSLPDVICDSTVILSYGTQFEAMTSHIVFIRWSRSRGFLE